MEREGKPGDESRWYRIGLVTGRFVRLTTIGIATSGVALGLIEGLAPHSWRTPGAIAAVAAGVFFFALAAAALRSPIFACFGLYFVLVGIGTVLQSYRPRPTAALIAIAVGTIVTSVTGTLLAFISGRRSKELDRLMFTESISVAFFVTMLGSLAYALLESWINAPKLSMWIVFTVGMWSWAVATMVFRRRYS